MLMRTRTKCAGRKGIRDVSFVFNGEIVDYYGVAEQPEREEIPRGTILRNVSDGCEPPFPVSRG